VQSALANVDGVEGSKVNFGDKEVTVTLKNDVSSTLLIDALKKGGFEAKEKKS
jgi:copper chaperone CopZ